jgi:MFS family permease
MPERTRSSGGGGQRALDLLNFFLADAQTGFGPFVSVYLTARKWTQVDIGFVLTAGTVVSLVSQLPAGALVDAARSKRLVAAVSLLCLAISALLLALLPRLLPVMVAQMLHGIASCMLTPVLAAISLRLVGHAALGERLGRNARYAAIGNGLAAAVMGAAGAWLEPRFVFLLTAALCVPALFALWQIGQPEAPLPQATPRGVDWSGLRRLVRDRRLAVFGLSVMLFHLSNAAMLPLAGSAVTMRAGHFASLIIAACIVAPQAVVALASPWVGRLAGTAGRRRILLMGWVALLIRGILFALLPGAWLLVLPQAISGLCGAAFGIALPLIASDLTRESGHFNLCLAALSLPMYVGAALSMTLGGAIADTAGMPVAFLSLGAVGALGTLVVWGWMPETRPMSEYQPAEAGGRLAT